MSNSARNRKNKIQWKVAVFGGSGGSAAVSHRSTLFIPMNIIIPKKAFLKHLDIDFVIHNLRIGLFLHKNRS